MGDSVLNLIIMKNHKILSFLLNNPLIQRFASKCPKTFAWVRNISGLLLGCLLLVREFNIPMPDWYTSEIANLATGFLTGLSVTSQFTTAKPEIRDNDKNYILEKNKKQNK